jgi:GrpB-like predicted nucleotidyltransferase (UPF0157 family)
MDLQSERIGVELVAHSPDWAAQARVESQRLAHAIGNTLLTVHHIGSTSIPGIKAKPTIDLLPLVSSLSALDRREKSVTALGYEWVGEFGLSGRRFLRLTRDGKRLFNVHWYEISNADVIRHLAFRDFLRTHPDEAKEYEVQKERACALHPDDVLAYNDAKNDWIKSTERTAIAWYAAQAMGPTAHDPATVSLPPRAI